MTPDHLGDILYVEDDDALSFVTKDHLELCGYSVTHCQNGEDAKEAFQSRQFDLCLLDVMLPKVDGFSLAEFIRHRDHSVPILFLTARSLKEDRLNGFRKGGDDYITKPYSIEELVMKIQVFLRRREIIPLNVQDRITSVGRFLFDAGNMTLQIDDKTKQLTQREAEVLKYFVDRPNELIKREDLLLAVWGEDDYFLGRSLDVFISKLRKYLRDDQSVQIQNIHGVGFKLLTPEDY